MQPRTVRIGYGVIVTWMLFPLAPPLLAALVAWAGGCFLAAEVRSSARPEDIPVLLSRFAETRDYFPEAEGLKVFGALASFYVDASLIRAAEREGLLVFGLSGGLLELLSSPELTAREF